MAICAALIRPAGLVKKSCRTCNAAGGQNILRIWSELTTSKLNKTSLEGTTQALNLVKDHFFLVEQTGSLEDLRLCHFKWSVLAQKDVPHLE